jgi:ABC-type multidrug transport system fused ATPase/permease subunit
MALLLKTFDMECLKRLKIRLLKQQRKQTLMVSSIKNQKKPLTFLLDFILGFPEGYETKVGERGITLSGGQIQRIGIARAILKNPKILILDEATSSLDASSEYLIQQALDTLMKGRTVIIIAHRLNTIKKAHRIFVIHEGQVIESGTYEQLMSTENGIFQRSVSLQMK